MGGRKVKAVLADLDSSLTLRIAVALIGLVACMPAGAQSLLDGSWTAYRHPTGVFLEHPASWRTQPTEVGIALVPGDFDPNSELIIALGESAAGLRGPTDPQVGQYLDVLVSQVAVAMRRTGQPTSIDFRGGTGALYEYRGVLNTGQPAGAQFRTAILGGYAVAIAIIATEEKLRQREPILQRIFASLGHAEPRRDPALVGTWRATSTESDSSLSGSVFFRTESVYALMPDGRLTTQSRTQGRVTGAEGGTAARDTEERSAGSWSAADGRLFILWDDGTSTAASYEATGDAVNVRVDGARAPIRLQRVR